MGVRVDIEWQFISPILQRASGVIKIWDIPEVSSKGELLLHCRCSIERGSMGFKGINEGEGISSRLLSTYDNIIKTMMRSYHDGMLLKDKQFNWIEESLHGDEMFDEWAKMQRRTDPYKRD